MSWQVIGALVPAALPVGFAWLMCENNGMTGDEAATVMRTAGTLGVVVTLASLASVLQLRRPAWAWARSLPTSASRRVREDAVALLVTVIPIWIAVASVHLLAGLAVAALSPLVALLAAGAMRRASDRITGTQGEVIAMGILLAVAVSRSWWLTLACVACTPLALHLATRRERNASATQLERAASQHFGRRARLDRIRMIRFENASFEYGAGRRALHATDLTIGSGLTLLLGPNGAGKSSLLKLAAGVERPRTGRVLVGDCDLWIEEVAARRQLAYVPEQPDLSPYATIADVARLVCSLRGEPHAAGEAALARAGLASLGTRTVRELSMGQRRRALLAMAFVGQPGHVLLDEPLEGMDRAMQDTIVAWVGERAAAGDVVVIATHELEPFVPLAARALLVVEGRAELVPQLPEAPADRLEVLERLARGARPESPAE